MVDSTAQEMENVSCKADVTSASSVPCLMERSSSLPRTCCVLPTRRSTRRSQVLPPQSVSSSFSIDAPLSSTVADRVSTCAAPSLGISDSVGLTDVVDFDTTVKDGMEEMENDGRKTDLTSTLSVPHVVERSIFRPRTSCVLPARRSTRRS